MTKQEIIQHCEELEHTDGPYGFKHAVKVFKKRDESIINLLKELTIWSDRIGSDELIEINEIILMLKNE